MIQKTYDKKHAKCKVTFRYQPQPEAVIDTIQVLGDFNAWGVEKKHFLKKRKDGSYSLTLNLPAKNSYEFRYLLNGEEWITDSEADSCIWNVFGSQNACIEV